MTYFAFFLLYFLSPPLFYFCLLWEICTFQPLSFRYFDLIIYANNFIEYSTRVFFFLLNLQNLTKKCSQNLEDHKFYQGKLTDCEKWLEKSRAKFDAISGVGNSRIDLESSLEKIQVKFSSLHFASLSFLLQTVRPFMNWLLTYWHPWIMWIYTLKSKIYDFSLYIICLMKGILILQEFYVFYHEENVRRNLTFYWKY